ncbi:hypothetical protein NC652_040863 [Populus alba x Populus x berolinensis]|nr:hypothetical protein NC652_040863 [Populus alba x Populus x berolinensis]
MRAKSSQPAQLENKKLRAETERVKAEDFDTEEGEPLAEEDELFDQKPAINDENPDVRQAAVYGIGICAGLGGSGSVFKPLVGAVAMSWFSLGSGGVLSKFLLHRRAMYSTRTTSQAPAAPLAIR